MDAKRYARHHCHLNDLEDAVQEALIAFVRHLNRLHNPDALPGWLSTTVKRACHRLHREQVRAGEPMGDELLDSAAIDDATDQRLDLLAAFAAMPPHYLEIILYRDFEEMSIQEIAAHLDEPTSTVKSRLHRARTMIRSYLATPRNSQ